jgi:hypothetical protein
MSRWLPTAALAAALVLSSLLSGCGSSAPPTTGKGGPQTSGAGPAATGRPAETAKEAPKSSSRHHDPG